MTQRTSHNREPRRESTVNADRYIRLRHIVTGQGNQYQITTETRRAQESSTNETSPRAELSGVYIISVAARLLEMHPQTLRKYEREGLITPSRTVGMLRLYSDDDLRRLRVIRRLVDELGLNLAGASLVLGLAESIGEIAELLERRPAVAGREAATMLRAILEYVGAD